MDQLHELFEEDSTITSSMTGVDYNDVTRSWVMTRQRQGVAEMLQYTLLVTNLYIRL